MTPILIFNFVAGVLIFLMILLFTFISFREEEYTAAKRGITALFFLPLPWLVVPLADFAGRETVAWILAMIFVSAFLLYIIPVRGRRYVFEEPAELHDERDIMFSRRLLKPGTERFEAYYNRRPENREPDDEFRKFPGLLSENAFLYDQHMFGSAEAAFDAVECFHRLTEGEPAADKKEINAEFITEYIKKWSSYAGAAGCGVTELKDYHKYTVIGRGEKYGELVELNHKYAIAFLVEMDFDMVKKAPDAPIVMESAQRYLSSGSIAVQAAQFIRGLGYPARAHIDADYRVICPLIARDAGLGELGRMGLLMTPHPGPRVRISVVTTDMPLITDTAVTENSVIDFCEKCKKCADACPSKAISFDSREKHNGVLRWKINSEACFTLWTRTGTDCGRCIAVCPYSHPDNFIHRIVRSGIRRSVLFRRFALWMDDVLYGRRPLPHKVEDWMREDK